MNDSCHVWMNGAMERNVACFGHGDRRALSRLNHASIEASIVCSCSMSDRIVVGDRYR